MTDVNCNETMGSVRDLSEDELNAITGGDAKAAAPASKLTSAIVFEVEDYSLDIEQVLSIG